jgi:hypothetical protein
MRSTSQHSSCRSMGASCSEQFYTAGAVCDGLNHYSLRCVQGYTALASSRHAGQVYRARGSASRTWRACSARVCFNICASKARSESGVETHVSGIHDALAAGEAFYVCVVDALDAAEGVTIKEEAIASCITCHTSQAKPVTWQQRSWHLTAHDACQGGNWAARRI